MNNLQIKIEPHNKIFEQIGKNNAGVDSLLSELIYLRVNCKLENAIIVKYSPNY